MKINLVTNLNKGNIVECIRLWSLQKTLKKRDFYVKIIDIVNSGTESLGNEDSDYVHTLFPNYIPVTQYQELVRELDNDGLCIVTGESVWKSKAMDQAGKSLLLKNVAKSGKFAYNVGTAHTQYSFLEKNIMKFYLKGFHSISVSTESDQETLSEVYKNEIAMTCDNVLLLRAS